MKKFAIALVLLGGGAAVFLPQRASLARSRDANEQLGSQVGVLRAHTADLEHSRVDLERRVAESRLRVQALEQEQDKSSPRSAEVIVPPHPARGGWPAGAPYFYLPKKEIGSISFRLLEGKRLTDDAATLFGMSDAEREAVNTARDELESKFRQLEIERMERVEIPSRADTNSPIWRYVSPQTIERMQAGAVAYRIPALENEAAQLRANFASSLQQTLGPARAGYLLETANDHIARDLADLGERARMIAFFQTRQRNGDVKVVYQIVNEGLDGTSWVLNSPLDPDSAEAYYARLFGVEVPIGQGR